MISDQPAIELEHVGVQRGGRWILRDIDWTVPAGACAAILGPNGSGKSTLARILAGHIFPTHGDCLVLGRRFGETDLSELRQRIRMVQAAGPYDVQPALTARETVLTGFFSTLDLYHHPTPQMSADADLLLEQVGLSHVIAQTYATLSSGERVRALIARALASRPALLILDEPTAGLDLLAREQVLATVQSLLNRNDLTVLFITHHTEELLPATSQILVLDDGKMAAQGKPAEVLTDEILSQVYRCPLHVEQQQGRYFVRVTPSVWEKLLNRDHAGG